MPKKKLKKKTKSVTFPDNSDPSNRIELSVKDILSVKCDALAVPSKLSPPPLGSDADKLATRVFENAGSQLEKLCSLMPPLKKGKVHVTSSFSLLNCSFLIHMPSDAVSDDLESIEKGVEAVLDVAKQFPCIKVVAFPPPPTSASTETMLNAISNCIRRDSMLEKVLLTCGGDDEVMMQYARFLRGSSYQKPRLHTSISRREPADHEDEKENVETGVTKLQALWRGHSLRHHTSISELVDIAKAKDEEEELARQALKLKWERARMKLKLKLELKRRREEKRNALHRKMNEDSQVGAAAMIQTVWRTLQEKKEITKKEVSLKKARAKLRLKLQIRLKRSQQERLDLLYSEMRRVAANDAALIIQRAWHGWHSRKMLDSMKTECGLSRDEILAKWQHAARRLQLKKEMDKRRLAKRSALHKAMAVAAVKQ